MNVLRYFFLLSWRLRVGNLILCLSYTRLTYTSWSTRLRRVISHDYNPKNSEKFIVCKNLALCILVLNYQCFSISLRTYIYCEMCFYFVPASSDEDYVSSYNCFLMIHSTHVFAVEYFSNVEIRLPTKVYIATRHVIYIYIYI